MKLLVELRRRNVIRMAGLWPRPQEDFDRGHR